MISRLSNNNAELHLLKKTFSDLLKLIIKYLLFEKDFSLNWTVNMRYLRDIFVAIRDEEILRGLRQEVQDEFRYDPTNKERQLRQLKFHFHTIDRLLLSIFENEFYKN